MIKWLLRRLDKYLWKRIISAEFAEELKKMMDRNNRLPNLETYEIMLLVDIFYKVIRRYIMGRDL